MPILTVSEPIVNPSVIHALEMFLLFLLFKIFHVLKLI